MLPRIIFLNLKSYLEIFPRQWIIDMFDLRVVNRVLYASIYKVFKELNGAINSY